MMHRVHMEASMATTCHAIPLEQNAELDVSGQIPRLFKGTWDKASIYYGEIKVRASGVVLEWMGDWPETIPIDLRVKIYTSGDIHPRFVGRQVRYTVRSVLAA